MFFFSVSIVAFSCLFSRQLNCDICDQQLDYIQPMFFYIERFLELTKKIQTWIKRNKNHLIGWSAFIFYEAGLLGLYAGVFSKFENYAIHYSINIAVFYAHAHIVLKKALEHKTHAYWRLPVYIALELATYTLVVLFADFLLVNYTNVFVSDIKFDMVFYLRTLFRGSYFIGFGTGYYFLITFIQQKRRADKLERIRLNSIIQKEQVEKELVKAQNAYLRAQINPHFLFNTLDFIYHNTRKIAPMAAETIAILSDIMRYATDTNFTGDFSDLGEEIDQITNLIRLHQLKNNFSLNVDFEYEEEIKQVKFIPLVLTTLVENMLKHGNLKNEDAPAFIKIYLENNILKIETSNSINANHNARGLHSGINNLTQRLKYAYGDQCEFKTHIDERNYFNVLLSVILKTPDHQH